MTFFKWIDGRQSTTKYMKFCFLYFKIFNIGMDGYIIKYEADTHLPIHKDPINGRHYRLNIKLKGKCKFWCPSSIFKIGERIIFFRPDIFPHTLKTQTKVIKLSLGLGIYNKKQIT